MLTGMAKARIFLAYHFYPGHRSQLTAHVFKPHSFVCYHSNYQIFKDAISQNMFLVLQISHYNLVGALKIFDYLFASR